jgi:hypothetical protein
MIALVHEGAAFLLRAQVQLAADGHRTVWLSDAARAYDAIKRAPPALVIVDIPDKHASAAWDLLHLLWLDLTVTRIVVLVSQLDARYLREKSARLRRRGCVLALKPCLAETVSATARAALMASDTDAERRHPPM